MSKSPKKNEKKSSRISALASKKRSNQKIRVLYNANWRILFWLSYTTFLIWPFFRGYSRNPEKKLVGFLRDLKTPKGQFEINWPLIIRIFVGTFKFKRASILGNLNSVITPTSNGKGLALTFKNSFYTLECLDFQGKENKQEGAVYSK